MKKFSIMKTVLVFLVALWVPITTFAQSTKITVGKFQSRALLYKNPQSTIQKPSPALILVPGSGEFGPEEMMPLTVPPTGREGRPLLSIFAQPFQGKGFHTLQLGKPGVEYFQSWETFNKNFYDEALWRNLHWQDLVANVEAAIEVLKKDPTVDSSKIYLLGHSEGTVVVSDVAAKHPEIAGVILLGYAGENIASTIQWQVVDRQIEMVVQAAVDANQDGTVTKEEAMKWPAGAIFPPSILAGPEWNWQAKPKIAISEIAQMWRQDPRLQKVTDMGFWTGRFPFWKEFVHRTDAKETTASIRGEVYVFTGEYDVNTPPEWSHNLNKVCSALGKTCHVEIIPKVTHKFDLLNATPVGPVQNVVLDQGHNPVEPSFLEKLGSLGKKLNSK